MINFEDIKNGFQYLHNAYKQNKNNIFLETSGFYVNSINVSGKVFVEEGFSLQDSNIVMNMGYSGLKNTLHMKNPTYTPNSSGKIMANISSGGINNTVIKIESQDVDANLNFGEKASIYIGNKNTKKSDLNIKNINNDSRIVIGGSESENFILDENGPLFNSEYFYINSQKIKNNYLRVFFSRLSYTNLTNIDESEDFYILININGYSEKGTNFYANMVIKKTDEGAIIDNYNSFGDEVDFFEFTILNGAFSVKYSGTENFYDLYYNISGLTLPYKILKNNYEKSLYTEGLSSLELQEYEWTPEYLKNVCFWVDFSDLKTLKINEHNEVLSCYSKANYPSIIVSKGNKNPKFEGINSGIWFGGEDPVFMSGKVNLIGAEEYTISFVIRDQGFASTPRPIFETRDYYGVISTYVIGYDNDFNSIIIGQTGLSYKSTNPQYGLRITNETYSGNFLEMPLMGTTRNWGYRNQSSPVNFAGEATPKNHLVSYYFNPTGTSEAYIDGITTFFDDYPTVFTDNDDIIIGRSAARQSGVSNIKITEIIITRGLTTRSDFEKIQGYLAKKYEIKTKLHGQHTYYEQDPKFLQNQNYSVFFNEKYNSEITK